MTGFGSVFITGTLSLLLILFLFIYLPSSGVTILSIENGSSVFVRNLNGKFVHLLMCFIVIYHLLGGIIGGVNSQSYGNLIISTFLILEI